MKDMSREYEQLKNDFIDGKNIFITGQAGTGKTYILKKLIEELEEEGFEIGLAGSTGTAAINIGGTTLHRLLGILNNGSIEQYEYARDNNMISFPYTTKVRALINKYDVIIIDEISMIGKNLLELMDHILKESTGHKELAFGGKQVVFSGDFLQLPPVKDKYAFQSEVWRNANFSTTTLTEVHRQDNTPFINILKDLRGGSRASNVIEFFKEREYQGIPPKGAIRLYSRNEDVETANKIALAELSGSKATFKADIRAATPSLEKQIAKAVQAVEDLELKIGAKVMSLVNHDELNYVNGSVGTVKRIKKEGVTVEFENGNTEVLKPHKWDLWEDGKQIAVFTQIPVKLAYALTIHKSQGQTIDGEVFVDCAGIRSGGQLYVAISRVKDPEKLKVVNFHLTDIKADHNALDFYGIEVDIYNA